MRVARVDRWEVHEHQVAAVAIVTLDAFVVIDEVAASVEDRFPLVDLDSLGVVRGMTVDDIDTGLIDQLVGEGSLVRRDFVTPVAPPVNGRHDDVVVLAGCANLLPDATCAFVGQVG